MTAHLSEQAHVGLVGRSLEAAGFTAMEMTAFLVAWHKCPAEWSAYERDLIARYDYFRNFEPGRP